MTNEQVQARRLAADGGLGRIEDLSAQSASLSDLAVDPLGNATAVSVFDDGTIQARRIAPDGTPGDVRSLSAAGEANNGSPQVAVDPQGDATAVFTSGSSQFLIRGSQYVVAPTCQAGNATVDFQTAKVLTLPCTGLQLQRQIVGGPGHGSLGAVDQATGGVTYTPAGGYSGADAFQFKATNPGGESAGTAFALTVGGAPPGSGGPPNPGPPPSGGPVPAPRPRDRDGDGVPDARDACPRQAGPTSNGCPDTDGDGVTDNVDHCPLIFGGRSNGCPPPSSFCDDPREYHLSLGPLAGYPRPTCPFGGIFRSFAFGRFLFRAAPRGPSFVPYRSVLYRPYGAVLGWLAPQPLRYRFVIVRVVYVRGIRARASRQSVVKLKYQRVKGSIAYRGRKGRNRVRFTGRMGRKALKPGAYVLVGTALARNGKPANLVSANFRVRGK